MGKCWNVLYLFAILATTVVWTSTHTLIPYHDLFQHPSFWWELLVMQGIFISLLRTTLSGGQKIFRFFKMKSILTFEWQLRMFLLSSLTYVFPYYAMYLVWTNYLSYNPPIPYADHVCKFLSRIGTMFAVWYGFSNDLRKKPEFRNRIKYYFYYYLWWIVIEIQMEMLSMVCHKLILYQAASGLPLQWLMAFLIPMCRELNQWILSKILVKVLGYCKEETLIEENQSATFAMESSVSISFALYVTVILSYTTKLTVACTLIVEFGINLFHCVRIIRMQKKINASEEQGKVFYENKEATLTSLITAELIEVLVPLTYAIVYAISYYGPNASLIARVKLNYPEIGRTEISDVEGIFAFLFTMFTFDTVGGIVLGLALKRIGNVKVMEKCSEILTKYWFLLALFLSGEMLYVS